jgi:outer membrane protein TolC
VAFQASHGVSGRWECSIAAINSKGHEMNFLTIRLRQKTDVTPACNGRDQRENFSQARYPGMQCILFLSLAVVFLSEVTARAEILTLPACLARASSANNSLKVAAFDEKIAAEDIPIARSSKLPRIDFQGGYTAQLEPQSINFDGISFPTQQADFGFFNLTLNQTLYDFGRADARYRRAVHLREAAAKDYAGREKDIFLQVIEAYYGIMERAKLLWAAEDEIKQRNEHLRVARNLYEQGVVTRNDLLQAELKLADSKQRQLDAANRVDNGWLVLNYLTGQPADFRAELEQMSAMEKIAPEESSAEQAFAGRPEIAALKMAVQASEAEVEESKSNFYPEIYAQLGVDYVQNSKVQEQAIYSATVGLRVNLFEGFATTARQRQAVQNRSRSEERLRLLEAQIRLELQMAKNDAGVAAQQIKTIEQAIQQGEENLRINQDRYSAQVGTATEVVDAQTLLTQIRTDYYRAVYSYQVAQARVKKALGIL